MKNVLHTIKINVPGILILMIMLYANVQNMIGVILNVWIVIHPMINVAI